MHILYNYPRKGRWIVVWIYRRCISSSVHRPWGGDSCFSIYQISWIKLKKVTFCKLKKSLSRNFVYNLQTFREFCQVHFTILLQIQFENNFPPTSEHWQAKFVAFLVFVCTTASFIAQISSSENISKRDAILAPVAKQSIAKDIPNYGSESKRAIISDIPLQIKQTVNTVYI